MVLSCQVRYSSVYSTDLKLMLETGGEEEEEEAEWQIHILQNDTHLTRPVQDVK